MIGKRMKVDGHEPPIFLAGNTSKETRKFRFRDRAQIRAHTCALVALTTRNGEVYEVDCYRNSSATTLRNNNNK